MVVATTLSFVQRSGEGGRPRSSHAGSRTLSSAEKLLCVGTNVYCTNSASSEDGLILREDKQNNPLEEPLHQAVSQRTAAPGGNSTLKKTNLVIHVTGCPCTQNTHVVDCWITIEDIASLLLKELEAFLDDRSSCGCSSPGEKIEEINDVAAEQHPRTSSKNRTNYRKSSSSSGDDDIRRISAVVSSTHGSTKGERTYQLPTGKVATNVSFSIKTSTKAHEEEDASTISQQQKFSPQGPAATTGGGQHGDNIFDKSERTQQKGTRMTPTHKLRNKIMSTARDRNINQQHVPVPEDQHAGGGQLSNPEKNLHCDTKSFFQEAGGARREISTATPTSKDPPATKMNIRDPPPALALSDEIFTAKILGPTMTPTTNKKINSKRKGSTITATTSEPKNKTPKNCAQMIVKDKITATDQQNVQIKKKRLSREILSVQGGARESNIRPVISNPLLHPPTTPPASSVLNNKATVVGEDPPTPRCFKADGVPRRRRPDHDLPPLLVEETTSASTNCTTDSWPACTKNVLLKKSRSQHQVEDHIIRHQLPSTSQEVETESTAPQENNFQPELQLACKNAGRNNSNDDPRRSTSGRTSTQKLLSQEQAPHLIMKNKSVASGEHQDEVVDVLDWSAYAKHAFLRSKTTRSVATTRMRMQVTTGGELRATRPVLSISRETLLCTRFQPWLARHFFHLVMAHSIHCVLGFVLALRYSDMFIGKYATLYEELYSEDDPAYNASCKQVPRPIIWHLLPTFLYVLLCFFVLGHLTNRDLVWNCACRVDFVIVVAAAGRWTASLAWVYFGCFGPHGQAEATHLGLWLVLGTASAILFAWNIGTIDALVMVDGEHSITAKHKTIFFGIQGLWFVAIWFIVKLKLFGTHKFWDASVGKLDWGIISAEPCEQFAAACCMFTIVMLKHAYCSMKNGDFVAVNAEYALVWFEDDIDNIKEKKMPSGDLSGDLDRIKSI